MNNNAIESIKWHKDQLTKLLSNEIGFYKVESELDSILEKATKKIQVKATAKVKAHTRTVKAGQKDAPDMVGRFGGPRDKGKVSDETKRLEDRLIAAKRELKGHTDKDRIKRTETIISDLERTLKEQKTDPRGALKF